MRKSDPAKEPYENISKQITNIAKISIIGNLRNALLIYTGFFCGLLSTIRLNQEVVEYFKVQGK